MIKLLDNDSKMLASIRTDKVKEKDLTNFLNKLRASRGLSDFATACVRACWENPSILRKAGYTQDLSDMTHQRVSFIHSIENEVSEAYKKINAIYDMALQTYVMAQFGKRMNLEEKSKLLLVAQFELQKSVKNIENALGFSGVLNSWDSNNSKLTDIEELGEKIFEYIVHTYAGEVQEIVDFKQSQQVVQVASVIQQQVGQTLSTTHEVKPETIRVGQQDNPMGMVNQGVCTQKPTPEYKEVDKENSLSAGGVQQLKMSDDADWSALDLFIGE